MGIQTTRYITRDEAEDKYVDKTLEEHRKFFHTMAKTLTNTELEDAIEEHFDNYQITNTN